MTDTTIQPAAQPSAPAATPSPAAAAEAALVTLPETLLQAIHRRLIIAEEAAKADVAGAIHAVRDDVAHGQEDLLAEVRALHVRFADMKQGLGAHLVSLGLGVLLGVGGVVVVALAFHGRLPLIGG